MEKLRLGWFSFTCCEDSTIIFTELLNDYWKEWKEKIDFVNVRVLKKDGEISNLDLSFVEGAISSKTQAEKLKKIRENSKILVAVGACALTSMPAGLRNTFGRQVKEEINSILIRFSHLEKVESLTKFVKIDEQIPGCPMREEDFLRVLNKYLK